MGRGEGEKKDRVVLDGMLFMRVASWRLIMLGWAHESGKCTGFMTDSPSPSR